MQDHNTIKNVKKFAMEFSKIFYEALPCSIKKTFRPKQSRIYNPVKQLRGSFLQKQVIIENS